MKIIKIALYLILVCAFDSVGLTSADTLNIVPPECFSTNEAKNPEVTVNYKMTAPNLISKIEAVKLRIDRQWHYFETILVVTANYTNPIFEGFQTSNEPIVYNGTVEINNISINVNNSPSDSITFVTTGSTFSPIIKVTGNPTISWIFGDGSRSNSTTPSVNFGSNATRMNKLVVTPWNSVTEINLGYDGLDGGIMPSNNTISALAQQNVIQVTGLEHVNQSLITWASSYNPIVSLDFSNFTNLRTVECYHASSLSEIKLKNLPSLTRLCVEACNLSIIDLSEAPALEDLRGAYQGKGRSLKEIIWGDTGAHLWHLCIHSNPNLHTDIPFNQFPVLAELIISGNIRKGSLQLHSNKIQYVLAEKNQYNAANFSGVFSAGSNGRVDIYSNNLSNLDITDDPGLIYLDAHHNNLNQSTVDRILLTLDSYNTSGGMLNLSENMAPSVEGISHALNLTARGWDVNIRHQAKQ